LGAGALHGCHSDRMPAELSSGRAASERDPWFEVRELFDLSPDFVHMSALYIASHPRPVAEAIDRYRKELDANPVTYLNAENRKRVNDVLRAAASYLGVEEPSDVAITDSTTSGVGLVYNGIRFQPGDEVITTEHDYYVTHESLRLASERTGMALRRVQLYDDVSTAAEAEIVERLLSAVTPRTRALALTWVHSGTGIKLPIAHLAAGLREINSRRAEDEEVLLCVDGVHGFGVENVSLPELGCDFFMAGCHKWLFGPRGTGIVWGSPRAWARTQPTIPSFLDRETHRAWRREEAVEGRTDGMRMSPGGFKPYEHQWAMKEAFDLHHSIGKDAIEERTHALAAELKHGLAKMPHVILRTPMEKALSAGIVCCAIDGMDPWSAVARLREQGIVATVTPYAQRYVRFAPSIRNTPAEIDRTLAAVGALA
jgi:selenocysteine lyase/cysteine desulfurase